MNYMTAKEAAFKWNLSERRVRTLCKQGRVAGAAHMGWVWSIPQSAKKPEDARVTRRSQARSITVEVRSMDFSSIEKKTSRLDAYRPLPKHTLDSLRESMNLEWTYNSNAIEGNTLTISETKVVLEGITVGG